MVPVSPEGGGGLRSLMARLCAEQSPPAPRAAVACIGMCMMLHNVLLASSDQGGSICTATGEWCGAMPSHGGAAGAGAEGFEVLRSPLAATCCDEFGIIALHRREPPDSEAENDLGAIQKPDR